ncbi:MAG: DNA-binding protein [Verrucomicrobiota bacterium]
MDTVISTRNLQIESKQISIDYRENERGRFLRIVEEAHGRRNTVIVPIPGLAKFTNAITEVLADSEKLTPV